MKKFFGITVIVLCAITLGLNLQYAFDGYGIKTGALHKVVLADGTGTGTGTGTDAGTYIPSETRCQTNVTITQYFENKVLKWTSTVKVCPKGNELSCEHGVKLDFADGTPSEGMFWIRTCN